MTERDVRAAYDVVADAYADHFPTLDAEQPVDLAMVQHVVRSLPGARRVLDAGCGAGRMLPFLATLGARPQGVDLSPEMVRRARADHPAHPVQVGSLTDLPLADESVDGVLAWYSTIHVPDADLPRALAEMRRVLVPGGLVCLGFQTGEGVRDVGEIYRDLGYAVEHLLRWPRTPDRLAGMLGAAGLVEVARMTRVAHPGERDGQAVLVARRDGD